MATMSILGLYQWDNSIFDAMVVPSQIDKDTLVMNILDECAELEILYTNPDFIKNAIGYWSLRRYHAWDKLQTVLYENYDPFVNIKRDEIRTITETRNLANSANETRNLANSANETRNLAGSNNETRNMTDTTKTNAYDSGTGTVREALEMTGTDNVATTDTGTRNISGTDTGTRNISGTDTGTVTTTENFHVEGDSAITDAQDVAMKESKLHLEYDLYNIIIDEFKRRFCLLVY